MGLASTIRQAALIEVEYPVGVVCYRLRPITSGDLLTEHFCLLSLLLPPSQEDRAQAEAEKEWPEAERQQAEQRRQMDMARKLSDPAVQQRIRDFNSAIVSAALVDARDMADASATWEPIRLVSAAESDPAAGKFSPEDIGPAVMEHLAAVVRSASFGGEVARAKLATFRGIRLGASHRANGSPVGDAASPAAARVG